MNIIEKHYRENAETLTKRLSSSFGWHQAEDIVQNAYERAYRYLNTVHKLDNWFSVILSNCVKDYIRDMITKGMEDSAVKIFYEDKTLVPTPEDLYIDKHTAYELIRVRHGKQRVVLDMYFMHGMNYAEIHEIMPDVRPDYLRKIISNFRKEIRRE